MSQTDFPRAVITGVGVRAPGALNVQGLWGIVVGAVTTARRAAHLLDQGLPVEFCCQVSEFDHDEFSDAKELRQYERSTQLGLAAVHDALLDAGLEGDCGDSGDLTNAAIVGGVSLGGVPVWGDQGWHLKMSGPRRLHPRAVTRAMPNALVGAASTRHAIHGHCMSVSTACAAGTNALGEGMRLIRDGRADMVLVMAADSLIDPLSISLFARTGAMSTAGDPSFASRPFDVARDGFVMAEAGACCVVETLDSARRRGVAPLAEVMGYGSTVDAFHMTTPRPDGAGAIRAMRAALDDARLTVRDIGSINAHGTSTRLNDASEAQAIQQTFGNAAPPVTSNKGALGHSIAAAGLVEAIVSLLSIRHGLIPPTANTTTVDPGIEKNVDVVLGRPRTLSSPLVMSNSFGFGGQNASIILGAL